MRTGFVVAFGLFVSVTWAAFLAANERGTDDPSAKEKATSEDAAVLSVALRHFGADKDAPSFAGREGKTAVPVHTDSDSPSAWLSDDQIKGDIDGQKWEVHADLRQALRQRNAKPVPLTKLMFGEGIVVADLKKVLARSDWRAPKTHADVRAYATVWLPAYSKDGQIAVVRFLFGPTPHGASATYLLAKEKDGWKVIEFKFAFYA